MRFSNPCSRVFENGMLSGSAQTRSWRVWAHIDPDRDKTRANRKNEELRKGEDIEHPPFCGVLRQIFHCSDKSQSCRFVARVKTTRHNRTGPSTDPRQDRDVLLAVRAFVGDRLAND